MCIRDSERTYVDANAGTIDYNTGHIKINAVKINSVENVDGVASTTIRFTAIPDSKWIAKYILKRVKPGSILLIHMPEKGVREWNYEAIELTLKGLKEKNLKILNLSQISKLSEQNNFISN